MPENTLARPQCSTENLFGGISSPPTCDNGRRRRRRRMCSPSTSICKTILLYWWRRQVWTPTQAWLTDNPLTENMSVEVRTPGRHHHFNMHQYANVCTVVVVLSVWWPGYRISILYTLLLSVPKKRRRRPTNCIYTNFFHIIWLSSFFFSRIFN